MPEADSSTGPARTPTIDTAHDSTATGSARVRSGRRSGARWWLLAGVCLATLLIGYLTVAALLAAVAAGDGTSDFDPPLVMLAALPALLACYQVPLVINGATLGVLPLLPTGLITALIGVATAGYARRCRLRRPDQAWPVVLTFALVHAFAVGLIALLVGPQVAVPPGVAFLYAGALAAAGAGAGVASRCGLLYLLWGRLGSTAWSGLRAGFHGLAALLGSGCGVVLLAIVAALPRLVALYSEETFGAGSGMTALSALYLPNAVLAGWSFAVGTGVSLGSTVVRPLQLESGGAPGFPLFELLPVHGPHLWWPLLFVFPLVTGVLMAAVCRRAHPQPGQRMFALAVGLTVLLVGTWVLANGAGGALAGGAWDPVGFTPGALVLGTLGWAALPAGLITWLWPASDAFDVRFPDRTDFPVRSGALAGTNGSDTEDDEDRTDEDGTDEDWGVEEGLPADAGAGEAVAEERSTEPDSREADPALGDRADSALPAHVTGAEDAAKSERASDLGTADRAHRPGDESLRTCGSADEADPVEFDT